MIESLAYRCRAGPPVEQAMPLVFKAIAVEVERLLDLHNADVLKSLNTTLDQLRNGAPHGGYPGLAAKSH